MSKMTAVLIAACVMLTLAIVAARQDPNAPLDPRIAAYDKGPAKIDVSKYPAPMQAAYKVFTAKCGKCHTIARAINCEFALEDEWERYIKRMMNKAGTLISPDEGKQIYDLLVYDSKTRKKDLYERKLKEAGKTGQ
jgi:cytochrome c5